MASSLHTLYQQLDQLSFEFIQKSYQALVLQYETIFAMLLTLYIVFYAVAVIRAQVSLSPIEVGMRLLVMSLIYVYATHYAYYAELAQSLYFSAEHLISSIMPYSNPSLAQASMVQVLSDSYGQAMSLFSDIWQSGGINNMGAYLLAMLGYLVFTLMAIMACGILLLAKVLLTVMLALAPLFIILLLFKTTQQFFYNFLNQLISWMLVPVFLFTLLGLFLTVLDAEIQAAIMSEQLTFAMIVPVLVLALASIVAFTYIPQVAAQIGGGFVSGVGTSFIPMLLSAAKFASGSLSNFIDVRRMERTIKKYSKARSQNQALVTKEGNGL